MSIHFIIISAHRIIPRDPLVNDEASSFHAEHSPQGNHRAEVTRLTLLQSLLAALCAVAMKIPHVLIYQGESGDLRDSWVEDIGDDTVYFAATPTEWSNNSIGRR